jgi:hypothetical protein
LAGDQGGGIVLANGLYVLGTLYAQQKRFHEAIAVFVRSLAISDKQVGEMSPNSALCVGDLATIYLKIHQPAEAEKFSNRAARLLSSDGTVAPVWLDVMQIHAQVLQKLNRKAEATEVQKQLSNLVASRRIRNQTVDVADLMRR